MCPCLLQPHVVALLRVSFPVLDMASNNPVRCFLPKRQKWFARLYWNFTRPLLFTYRTHRQGSPTRSPPADTSFSSRRGRQLPQVPVRSGSIEQGIQKKRSLSKHLELINFSSCHSLLWNDTVWVIHNSLILSIKFLRILPQHLVSVVYATRQSAFAEWVSEWLNLDECLRVGGVLNIFATS